MSWNRLEARDARVAIAALCSGCPASGRAERSADPDVSARPEAGFQAADAPASSARNSSPLGLGPRRTTAALTSGRRMHAQPARHGGSRRPGSRSLPADPAPGVSRPGPQRRGAVGDTRSSRRPRRQARAPAGTHRPPAPTTERRPSRRSPKHATDQWFLRLSLSVSALWGPAAESKVAESQQRPGRVCTSGRASTRRTSRAATRSTSGRSPGS